MSHKPIILRRAIYGIALFLLSILGTSDLWSQPSGYCVPYPKDGYQYQYCTVNEWGYYGFVGDVKVTNLANSQVVYERVSGNDICYIFTGEEINLKLGNSYKVEVRTTGQYPYGTYSGWYFYHRLWIDWNQNGSFADAGEFQGTKGVSCTVSPSPGYSNNTPAAWTISVPCNVIPGKTRMRVSSCYAYDNGADACSNGYVYAPYYNYNYGEMEDYVLNFIPDIEATFPPANGIVYANEPYDGTQRMKGGVLTSFPKPSVTMGSTQPTGAILKYKITGPRPSTSTVYSGLDPTTGTTSINMAGFKTYTMQRASGTYAYGTDGSFMSDRGGEYKIAASVSGSGCPGDVFNVFTVAWQNDIAINDILSPKNNGSPRFQKYLRNNTIAVQAEIQNVGINTVTDFWAYFYIVNNTGDTIYRFSRHYDSNNNPTDVPLTSTAKTVLSFGNIRIPYVGVFKCYVNVDLQSALDQEEFNDIFPRAGDADYTFEIAYDIELWAEKMLSPTNGQVLIGNRPIIPLGQFRNLGASDASDVPSRLNVYKLPTNTLVYTDQQKVQDVPMGKYNTKVQEYSPMIIRESGTYIAELIISHEDDAVRTNDTLRYTFTVEGGLCGTYTVGAGGNFPTIDSVMNTLYYRGLACSATFLLTDSYYKVTGNRMIDPAWDFSSYIINLGYDSQTNNTNTITWKPSAAKAVAKGSVVVDLFAPNGKGINFGQSMDPANPYSVYKEFFARGSLAKQYVNSGGNIIFDGGSQKSLKFRMNTGSRATSAAFYLGRGSHDITVKNVLIENASTQTTSNIWLPLTQYSPITGFTFQPDTLLSGPNVYGFSAGVVNRSTLFGTEIAQLMRVDTVPNTNNKIQNNEITGFAYGVMSLGIGPLWMENIGEYQRWYNKNNTISGNIISNAGRTGVYAGYEENTSITGNRIFNINNASNMTAGIMAGGDGTSQYKGYNNIGLTVRGNEISGVSSGYMAAGIKLEQTQNPLPHSVKGQVFYPDVNENTVVTNNAVYNVTTTNANAVRAGITLYTTRGADIWTPSVPGYWTRGDKVINNTVIMGSNGSVASIAPVTGICVQNGSGVQMWNNAVALQDVGVDASNPVYSAFAYQGPIGGISSDRNAYWAPANANASFFRFIETNKSGTNLEGVGLQYRYDYKTLDQWRAWTKNDMNSVYGNFTSDLVYLGTDPMQYLRVQSNPTPLGSVLNNRGERFTWLTTDIDGNQRGPGSQRYDIGASEFDGRLYISDVEAITVSSPVAYKAGTGFFSDAEYIMTTAPIDIKTVVRNSGNLQQNQITLTLNLYRELPNGLFNTAPELTTTTKVTIPSGESAEASFNLADGVAPDFMPLTYGALRGQGYVLPAQFSTMEANITPKYMIKISIQADQNNTNNDYSKVVRFYIRKSDMRIVLSAENSFSVLDANSTLSQIAGKLNYDSLYKAMSRLGWKVDITNNRFDLDIFDRNGWEPKAVNYDIYRTMWWSDENDKSLTRYQIADIMDFLNKGNEIEKRNIIISSQDIARSTTDQTWINGVLRSLPVAPYNPKGLNGDNNGNTIKGVATFRNMQEGIQATGWAGDALPYCGLTQVYPDGEGLSQVAATYNDHSGSLTDNGAGVVTSTLNRNVVLYNVDWRHWKRADYILRASIDYIEKNGGTIIPVELLSFDAKAIGNRVDVNWSTASEYQTDKFEVEKAVKTDAGVSSFVKIGEVKAAGTSSEVRTYGPVSDFDVRMNNTYVYRLKMIDRTGEFKYSDEKEVNLADGNAYFLGEAYPNPASTSTEISYSMDEQGYIEITLVDMSGKTVKTVYSGNVNAGTSSLTINTADLSSGSYNVVMKSGSRMTSRTLQVIK